MEARMLTLAEQQPGYLGRETADSSDGHSLTIVYYADEASVRAWHAHPQHRVAQRLGREQWYESYEVQIAKVERAYRFSR
jgi:heme-degrading monooxygenase HmoA